MHRRQPAHVPIRHDFRRIGNVLVLKTRRHIFEHALLYFGLIGTATDGRGITGDITLGNRAKQPAVLWLDKRKGENKCRFQ